uniref:Thioredoxin domain-containing protein n=1 Tax=viral metagenome TaxID=1070528 RepID=A0A6C0DRP3_9ZZZZ
MSGVLDFVKRTAATYSKYIFIVLIFIIFVLIGKYVYDSYFTTKEPQFSNVANASTGSVVAKIYFFNVDWCPHCVNAKPAWKEFCEDNNGKQFGGYVLECVGGVEGTNCTNEQDPAVSKYITEFKIEGYPTVKIVKDGEQIEYGTKITKETLEQYVNAVLA